MKQPKLEKSASAKELDSMERTEQNNKEGRIKEIVKRTMSPGRKLTLIKKVYGRDLTPQGHNADVMEALKQDGCHKDMENSEFNY